MKGDRTRGALASTATAEGEQTGGRRETERFQCRYPVRPAGLCSMASGGKTRRLGGGHRIQPNTNHAQRQRSVNSLLSTRRGRWHCALRRSAARQSQDQVARHLILDVVVGQCVAVLQLLASKDQA
eukprot:CAMPEP_0119066970 /NCGR_PEP_ID=MMETSP1178-20130426/9359_1 /TAXON_ID=33656 /ORGANISM="unid sp, Strain CCMP2000" /LENGTH=125 /DNA_ID=CAMNT_0007048601 /DNA_START=132 /DNA_END=506 /DNA_ORIENTATION=+